MGIDLFTLFAQVLNFLILLWLLRRFLWGPITRVMAEREAGIAAAAEAAERAQAEAEARAQALEAEHSELRRARQAREARLEQELEGLREDRLEALNSEVVERRERARADLARERQDAEASLRRGVQALVSDALVRGWRDLAGTDLEAALRTRFGEHLATLDEEARHALAVARERGELRIVSAGELDEAARATLLAALPEGGGEAPSPHFETDPALIAGVRLFAGHSLLDASVAARIDDLVEAWGSEPGVPG
jgi:F-type H+-transporting ATPase subunit b